MIKINSILFTDDYTGIPSGNGPDNGVPYLMGNVGDLIYANIDFYVQWSTLNTNIDFSSASHTIIRKDCGTITGSFIQDGFKIGDTVIITGSQVNDGTYTVSNVTSTILTVNENLTDSSDTGVSIYGVTLVNYFDFYYNLIGANEAVNYNSLTDSKAVQKFSGTSNPYYYGSTFSLSPNSTSRAWWANKVDGVDVLPVFTDLGYTADHKQHFKVQFPFLITPLFLANQLQLLQNAFTQSDGSILNTTDFNPVSYFDNQCLKFIYQIDAKFKAATPAPDHSSIGTNFENGNTSWFNTFFPSGVYLGGKFLTQRQYDFVSIVYKDNAGNTLDSIDVNNATSVTVQIKRSGSNTISEEKFIVNFMWLPTDAGAYQGYSQSNQADFRQVFLHDRCKSAIGQPSKNGDQYGTSVQAITNVVGSTIDTNNFKVDFKIDLGSLSKQTMRREPLPVIPPKEARETRLPYGRYVIWISPQTKVSNSIDTADRNAVLCDVNNGFINTDDASLLTVVGGNTFYFKYPDTYINKLNSFNGLIGDYGLFRNQFQVKPGCVINDVSVITEVQILNKTTNALIDTMQLDSWVKPTGQFYNGIFTDININESPNYSLPTGDLRNTRSINRLDKADPAGKYAYEIIYGFQLGYQYWQNITDFPSSLVQFHTQYWSYYTQQGVARELKNTWQSLNPTLRMQIVHKIIWNVTDTSTDITTQFIQYSNIFAYDSISNASGNSVSIDIEDELGESLQGVIPLDIPAVMVATMQGNFNVPYGQLQPVGILVAMYSDGTKTIYDQITTLDTEPETENSIWTDLPVLLFDSTNSNGLLQCDFNLQGRNFKNIILYAKLQYQTDNGLVTDTSLIQLQTDTSLIDLIPD